MRILVTGSRDWDDRRIIHQALAETAKDKPDDSIVLIHGGARGADYIADTYARAKDWGVEVYKADWEAYGKMAGILRNIDMVREANPDICLAFIKDHSRGATHCYNAAKNAFIPVKLFRV